MAHFIKLNVLNHGHEGTNDRTYIPTLINLAYNLDYKVAGFKNQAFAGAGASFGYGDGLPTWHAGPLIGNRFFVKDNVYILAQANYDVGLNNVADNAVRYTLGLGVRF